MQTTEREQASGLEVQLPTNPEVAGQPYESKYPIEDGGYDYLLFGSPAQNSQGDRHNVGDKGSSHPIFDRANQPGRQPQTIVLGRSRAFWTSAVITVVLLIIALGAGLGAGLATQHKPSSPR